MMQGTGDAAFLRAKLPTARFYAEHVLTQGYVNLLVAADEARVCASYGEDEHQRAEYDPDNAFHLNAT